MISGCQNNLQVSTNLDKENFQQYFSANKVKIYQNEQDIKQKYQALGVVEGEDCQLKAHHAAPNEINARTQARQKAFEKQGNGIIFTGCALINESEKANYGLESKQCYAVLVCYAKALKVQSPPTAEESN